MSDIVEKFFRSRTARYLSICARLFLAVLFLWAGISKLLDPDKFAVIIDEFGILPTKMIWPVAYALPVVEVMAGIGLVFNVWGSLALATALMIFFIGIVSYGIWKGIDVDCGCFGMYDSETSLLGKLKPALARDFLFLLPIVYIYWFRWKQIRNKSKKTMQMKMSNSQPGDKCSE